MAGALPDGIVDTMIGFLTDPDQLYALLRRELLRDRESKEAFTMPAAYMFRDLPQHQITGDADPVSFTLSEMERFGVEVGLVSLSASRELTVRAKSISGYDPSTGG
jgi:hypothetical protein